MGLDNNQKAFFTLLKAGLWKQEVSLSGNGEIDYATIMQMAEEQSVVGLITAALDHAKDVKVPQEWALQFIGSALQLEQQNTAMNAFIADLIAKMRAAGIYTLLVKGQGVAQFYEKPLWRSCGDVDLFLSDDNYLKAKDYLLPKASFVEEEEKHKKHLAMTINDWMVELHGSLRCGFSSRVDKELDKVYKDTFYGGNVSSWNNQGTQVFMLGKENNVLYVFVHFLNHFYKGGVGLRQICDWCRLLWTYREKLDMKALVLRIKQMGLVSEWKAFGALAVEWLGMSTDAMPMYDESPQWSKKANRIIDFIMMSGNMGHNRISDDAGDKTYYSRKVSSFGQRAADLINHMWIFPLDSIRFFPSIVLNGIRQK